MLDVELTVEVSRSMTVLMVINLASTGFRRASMSPIPLSMMVGTDSSVGTVSCVKLRMDDEAREVELSHTFARVCCYGDACSP